jgi:hypothetical protein
MNGDSLIGLLVIAGVLWLLMQRPATRTLRVHVNGEDEADAARHEAGHAANGKALGGRVGRARVFPDGSGWVEVHLPRNAPVEHDIAVSLAGGIREGVNPLSAAQCRGDRANINRTMRRAGLRGSARAAAIRRAMPLARKGLHSGYAASVERRLLRTGRL